jgi:DNA (cytosine-5)-methyltransferase 1
VLKFLEFFAGGGMARAGLQGAWESVWANDFCPSKAAIYTKNWGNSELVVGDVACIEPHMLPYADMIWGSFPCQDLSLAGDQKGIGEEQGETSTRSGSFWPFWNLVRAKQPPLVVLENVVGALTSNGGLDISTIFKTLAESGYVAGPLVMDAIMWVPQSRPRLFVVAVRRDVFVPALFRSSGPLEPWHTDSVCRAFAMLDEEVRRQWIWWSLPLPTLSPPKLAELIEAEGDSWVSWNSDEKTAYLLSLMSDTHRKKLADAMAFGRRIVGLAYRRTRQGRQRLEVRFDGVAGCLRTAGGGSSKQIVIEVNGDRVRSRLLSPREAARLQGLPDDYWLPQSYNEAYDLVGDGLCVPVVRHLGETLLTAIAQNAGLEQRATA